MLAKTSVRIVDREREITTLVSSMLDPAKNINYAMIGVRRIGKTTILQDVRRTLRSKGLIVAYLDFSVRRYDPLGFFRELTNGVTTAYHELGGAKARVLDHARAAVTALRQLRRARIRLELAVDPATGQPIVTPIPYFANRPPDYSTIFKAAFEYANEIARRSRRRVVLIIDEVQHLADWRRFAGLEAVFEQFKNVVEARQNVVYVISGSRAHFLRDFLSSGRSPLFGLFHILEVTGLHKDAAKELYRLNDATAEEGDAEQAHRLVSGHPFYLIALATTRRPGERLAETYRRGLTASTGALHLYVRYVLAEDIGTIAKGPIMMQILTALAGGPKRVSQIAAVSGVKLTSLPKFLRKLLDLDLVRKREGRYELVDQVIADYLRLNA